MGLLANRGVCARMIGTFIQLGMELEPMHEGTGTTFVTPLGVDG